MAELLDDTRLETALHLLAGWAGDTTEISRTARLPSFPAAIRVVDRVAEVAEKMDHHPDMDIRWRSVTFHCTTHAKGGVTERDIALAQRIDAIVNEAATPA